MMPSSTNSFAFPLAPPPQVPTHSDLAEALALHSANLQKMLQVWKQEQVEIIDSRIRPTSHVFPGPTSYVSPREETPKLGRSPAPAQNPGCGGDMGEDNMKDLFGEFQLDISTDPEPRTTEKRTHIDPAEPEVVRVIAEGENGPSQLTSTTAAEDCVECKTDGDDPVRVRSASTNDGDVQNEEIEGVATDGEVRVAEDGRDVRMTDQGVLNDHADLSARKLDRQLAGDFMEDDFRWTGNDLVKTVVGHSAFNVVSATLILINVVLLTVVPDRRITASAGENTTFFLIECGFAGLFTLELLFRIIAYGNPLKYFCDSDGTDSGFGLSWITGKAWNMLDLMLVVLSVLAISLSFVTTKAEIVNVSFVRVIRLKKVVGGGRLGRQVRKSVRFRLWMIMVKDVMGTIAVTMTGVLAVMWVFAAIIAHSVSVQLAETDGLSEIEQGRLQEHWGSYGKALLSLYMGVTSGKDWNMLADPLRETTFFWGYAAFLIFTAIYILIVTNFITALFFQSTLRAMKGPESKALDVQMKLESKEKYIKDLTNLFDDEIDFDEMGDFDNPQFEKFLALVGLNAKLARNVWYVLSKGGRESVDVKSFVVVCMEMSDTPTNLDLLQLRVNTWKSLFMTRDVVDEQSRLTRASSSDSCTTVMSQVRKKNLQVKEVMGEDMATQLVALCCKQIKQNDKFADTVSQAVRLALQTEGGLGLLIADNAAFEKLLKDNVDFQVCDRCVERGFKDGYMTRQLRTVNSAGKPLCVHDEEFARIVNDFANHALQDEDKWPDGHEAAGLPKDGYILIGAHGPARKAAVRITGLPTPPYRWEGVGTRHLSGLAAAHALLGEKAVVVVRSESGAITAFCPMERKVKVIKVPSKRKSVFQGGSASSIRV